MLVFVLIIILYKLAYIKFTCCKCDLCCNVNELCVTDYHKVLQFYAIKNNVVIFTLSRVLTNPVLNSNTIHSR